MHFILEQLRLFGTAALVMVCATVGTVGLLKLIKRFAPEDSPSKDAIAQKWQDQQSKEE